LTVVSSILKNDLRHVRKRGLFEGELEKIRK
jgi:hypothetical protein